MIRGFKGKCMTTAEEWLIDYSLRTCNSIDINTDLLDMPITFDGKEVDAFILDVHDNKLVIQLALPIATKFDDKSGRYAISYVRKLINSNEFLSRFNSEFVKHIQLAEVHTEDYMTNDKFWLLSHEEVINRGGIFLKPNHKCHMFEMFKTIDLEAYSRMLLKNEIDVYGWRLRSTYSSSAYNFYDRSVGYINNYGGVNYSYANYTYVGELCPACTIC